MNLQIHNIKDIFIGKRENLWNKAGVPERADDGWQTFTRDIVITRKNGAKLKITLFSDDKNKLAIRDEGSEEILDEMAREKV